MSMNLKKSASNTQEQYEEQSKKVFSISQPAFVWAGDNRMADALYVTL